MNKIYQLKMFNRLRAVSCFSSNLEGWASVKKRVTSDARVAYFFFARFPWQTEIKERKKRRYCSQLKFITEHANIFKRSTPLSRTPVETENNILGSVLNGNPEVICECTRAVNALNLQSGFPALESSSDQQPSRSRVQLFQSLYFKQLTGLSFAFWVF